MVTNMKKETLDQGLVEGGPSGMGEESWDTAYHDSTWRTNKKLLEIQRDMPKSASPDPAPCED